MDKTRRKTLRGIIGELQAVADKLEDIRAAEATAQANIPASLRSKRNDDVPDAAALLEGATHDLDELIHLLECCASEEIT